MQWTLVEISRQNPAHGISRGDREMEINPSEQHNLDLHLFFLKSENHRDLSFGFPNFVLKS